MILVSNFTELYNILKTHPNLKESHNRFSEFVGLVDTFQQMCSCRGSEKNRIKLQIETQYRNLILNEITANINLFVQSLGDKKIKFLYNQSIVKEFG